MTPGPCSRYTPFPDFGNVAVAPWRHLLGYVRGVKLSKRFPKLFGPLFHKKNTIFIKNDREGNKSGSINVLLSSEKKCIAISHMRGAFRAQRQKRTRYEPEAKEKRTRIFEESQVLGSG